MGVYKGLSHLRQHKLKNVIKNEMHRHAICVYFYRIKIGTFKNCNTNLKHTIQKNCGHFLWYVEGEFSRHFENGLEIASFRWSFYILLLYPF